MVASRRFPYLVALVLLAGCSDTSPPTWRAGATLEVGPEATQIRVTWPDPLEDDVLVFAVSVDGEERTRATTSTHTVTVSDLEDETSYVIQVVAIDHDENVSAPLTISATTLDGTPPEWPAGAELTATSPDPKDAEERRVDLSWPAAVDATVYRVSREATEVGAVEVMSYQVSPAPLGADTRFEVRALDEAGNESEPLTVVWGETDQAEREANEDAVAENEEGDGRRPPPEMRILGVLSADSGGSIADVLSNGAIAEGGVFGATGLGTAGGIRATGAADEPDDTGD
jgi:hypothetical protein